VIEELSRSTLPLVFLATFFADSAKSSQVTSHLQPTRRRNLGLADGRPSSGQLRKKDRPEWMRRGSGDAGAWEIQGLASGALALSGPNTVGKVSSLDRLRRLQAPF
jgi:hypothetical protein